MGGFRIFTLAGVPVHVTAWYFLILLFWLQGGIQSALTWGGAITLSILVHEFGHAMVAKIYGLNPSIELHGWGGLCHHQRAASDKHDALILIAGPGAGLVFGGVVFAVVAVVPEVMVMPFWGAFAQYLLYVNLVWSLVNLVPLWPLDGGQLFRLGMLRLANPGQAERITHVVGTVLGVGAVFIAYSLIGSRFLAVIAGFITWMNIQRINNPGASGAIRSQNRFAKGLLKQAKDAFSARDWETAARLAYQAKAETGLDAGTISQLFEILGVSNAAMGRFEDAWPYLQKAPESKQVFLAKVECVLALEMSEEARPLLLHKAAVALPDDVQRDLAKLADAVV